MENVKEKCVNCGVDFFRSKGRHNAWKKNGGKNSFCSIQCVGKFHNTNLEISCKNCGNKIFRQKGDVERSTSGNFFCNTSCAATYNNVKFKKREKTKPRSSKCLSCENELWKKTQRNYCDNTCKQKHLYDNFIKGWLSGEHDGSRKNDKEHTSSYVKRYLREIYENKCQKCRWGEINVCSDKIPLEVHHKDGNWKNNSIDNLELLCPNCHSLTPNYRNGGKRERKGRTGKRKFYRENKSSRWVKI